VKQQQADIRIHYAGLRDKLLAASRAWQVAFVMVNRHENQAQQREEFEAKCRAERDAIEQRFRLLLMGKK